VQPVEPCVFYISFSEKNCRAVEWEISPGFRLLYIGFDICLFLLLGFLIYLRLKDRGHRVLSKAIKGLTSKK